MELRCALPCNKLLAKVNKKNEVVTDEYASIPNLKGNQVEIKCTRCHKVNTFLI